MIRTRAEVDRGDGFAALRGILSTLSTLSPVATVAAPTIFIRLIICNLRISGSYSTSTRLVGILEDDARWRGLIQRIHVDIIVVKLAARRTRRAQLLRRTVQLSILLVS